MIPALALAAIVAVAGADVPANASVRSLDVTGDVAVDVTFAAKAGARGAARTVDVTGDATVSFADGRLKVAGPSQADGPRPRVTVVVDSLTEIATRGVAQVHVRDVPGKSIEVNASGASLVTLAGKASSLVIVGRGTARVDADGLTTSSADVTLQDAARAEVRPSFSLTCDLSRASRLVVKTKPSQVKKKVSGVAKLVMP